MRSTVPAITVLPVVPAIVNLSVFIATSLLTSRVPAIRVLPVADAIVTLSVFTVISPSNADVECAVKAPNTSVLPDESTSNLSEPVPKEKELLLRILPETIR